MTLCTLGLSCERSCEHGVHFGQEQCHLCDLQNKINTLENVDYDERIHDLENVGVESRLLALEEKISEKYAHPDVIGRIERLEKYKSLVDSLNNNRNDWIKGDNEIMQFIREINCVISQLCKKITELYQHKRDMDSKRPYKCPICHGIGEDRSAGSTGMLLSFPPIWPNCKVCKGEGVVWG